MLASSISAARRPASRIGQRVAVNSGTAPNAPEPGRPVWSWIAFVVSVVQVVLTTALATLMASLYNLAAYFVGGLQVVLTED